MALRNPSLFLYGFQVTTSNASIDFKSASLGPTLQATLNLGFYSLTSLGTEISRAMHAVDPANTYTVTVNRNVAGGTQNRVTIATSGSFLSLLFGSGPRAASSVAPLIGFNSSDYTGMTSYTGSFSAGTVLIPNLVGYNYLSPDFDRRLFGSVNVSASGDKEAIVFSVQRFWRVQFRYIPETTWTAQWTALMNWMIQQRRIEFTPDVTTPSIFFEGTLETTPEDSKGLKFMGKEMLPQFPFQYDTGLMIFRQSQSASFFI